MTLNCLTCQVLQRTNSSGSDRDCVRKDHKAYRKLCCVNINIERSWSGNLTPPPYGKIDDASMFMQEKNKVKAHGHRRLMSTGGVAYEGSTEPRLVRSSGMRRDWSFENLALLRNDKNQKGRKNI